MKKDKKFAEHLLRLYNYYLLYKQQHAKTGSFRHVINFKSFIKYNSFENSYDVKVLLWDVIGIHVLMLLVAAPRVQLHFSYLR